MNVLSPELSLSLEPLDAHLAAWSRKRGGLEQRWPVLMEESTLRRAGYPDAFPHLLMTAGTTPDPVARPDGLASSGWYLSPAVCYHVYAALEGRTIKGGVKLGARGHCFRNEVKEDLWPGRRQIEFQMRELVFIGEPEWIERELAGVQDEIMLLAARLGLLGSWEIASDPFFLPTAKGKARMQRLKETKREFCLPDGLAIASINRHGAFFGERFGISQEAGGQACHSACVAFGLDRWAAHATNL
ncbi:MAG: seryl-tRNA synthetase [Akkermansiaceae bacterium]|nr:seryl-tRNA synthetase [Akkermansiaceae bacterium]